MTKRTAAFALLGIVGVVAVLTRSRAPHTPSVTVVDPHGTWGLLDRRLTPRDLEYEP